MASTGGLEYFWMARRVMQDYKIGENEFDDVLAHSVYLAFIIPIPLSFTLIRWCVLRAVRIHCGIKKYTLVPFHQLDNSWVVYQPEIQDTKIVKLSDFRNRKKLSL
jgi:hypothetical protein